MHTFSDRWLTSRTLFRNLCTLSLNLLHTVCPTTGCPALPGQVLHPPALLGRNIRVCFIFRHPGQRRGLLHTTAACTVANEERCCHVHPRSEPAGGARAGAPPALDVTRLSFRLRLSKLQKAHDEPPARCCSPTFHSGMGPADSKYKHRTTPFQRTMGLT